MYLYYYIIQNNDEIIPIRGNDYNDAKNKIKNMLFEKFSKTKTNCTVQFKIIISSYSFEETMEIKDGKLKQ